MSEPEVEPTSEPARPRRRGTWLVVALLVVAVLVIPYACSASGGSSGCAAEARRLYSGDNRFVEVTHSSGALVKGVVKEFNGGVESVVRYWECKDGEITWSSLAG